MRAPAVRHHQRSAQACRRANWRTSSPGGAGEAIGSLHSSKFKFQVLPPLVGVPLPLSLRTAFSLRRHSQHCRAYQQTQREPSVDQQLLHAADSCPCGTPCHLWASCKIRGLVGALQSSFPLQISVAARLAQRRSAAGGSPSGNVPTDLAGLGGCSPTKRHGSPAGAVLCGGGPVGGLQASRASRRPCYLGKPFLPPPGCLPTDDIYA